MSNNFPVLIYCECLGPHKPDCPVPRRLALKDSLMKQYKIKGCYVPEWLEEEIDRKMSLPND